MAKFSLSKALHRKKRFQTISLIVGPIALIAALSFFVFNNPKSLQAAVIINGTDATIDGGNTTTFVVDSNGNVYQQPTYKFTDTDLNTSSNEVDFRYYSYLATPVYCNGAVCNVKSKSLTIRNGMVLMEGTQSLKNLYIESTGSVSQPFADRTGMINKPIYTDDYWGIRFTGFLKIPANSVYYLSSDSDVKDSVQIEYLNSSTVDATDSKNNWSSIYIDANDVSKTAWSNGEKRNLTIGDYVSGGQYPALTNDSSTEDKWVPIRFSFAKGLDKAKFGIKYEIYDYYHSGDYSGFFPDKQFKIDSGYLGLGRVYGVSANGTPEKTTPGLMNFEYFVSKDGASFVSSNFGNAVKTVESKNIDIKTILGSNYGYIGGSGNTFQLAYNDSSQLASPIADSIAMTHRIIASRHSAYNLNTSLFSATVSSWPTMFQSVDNQSRRIDAGLTLNIDNELRIDGEKGINLTGTGYPGWANEFYTASDYLTITAAKNVGGGPGGGESSSILGGGASFARKGGSVSTDLSAVNYGSGKVTYDDASEVISKNSLGSGGGSSGKNLGGSGGGAIKVISKKATINAKSAIAANGNGGMLIDTIKSVTGGSGGKIVVKSDELALGSNIDSGALKNEIFNADGYGNSGTEGIQNCSGGSGGYIVVAYNITNDAVIIAKNYSFRLHLTGGPGLLGGSLSNNIYGGEAGVLSVVTKSSLETISIKKWLLPLDRPTPNSPPNPNFNPYALQFKDKIRVNLIISGAVPGFEAAVEDEVLKVISSNESCKPIDGSIGVPNNSVLLNSGYDAINNKVYWNLVPNGADPVTVYYDCQVTN